MTRSLVFWAFPLLAFAPLHGGEIPSSADPEAEAVDAAVGGLLSLAGVKSVAPVDEVIRVYKVKNISLFAQLNFSFTEIGKNREMIAIRSDSANFGSTAITSSSMARRSTCWPRRGGRRARP